MSVKAVKWAMFQAVGDAQSKLLLMTLAEHHNEKTGCCDPGQKRLSILCECDEEGRTVRRHLAKLESAGFLRKQKRGGNGDGRQSDEYELALDRPGELKAKLPDRAVSASQGEEVTGQTDGATGQTEGGQPDKSGGQPDTAVSY